MRGGLAPNLRFCHPSVPSTLFMHCHLRRSKNGSLFFTPPPHRQLRFSRFPFPFVVASSSSIMEDTIRSAEASKPPFSVLFVCLGNICRSPAAEAVFTDIVRKRGLESKFRIDSAGTIGYHEGNPADSRMRAAAKKRGIEVTSISRPVQPSDFRVFDLILAMDMQNRDDLLSAFDRWSHKEKLPKDAYKKVKLMCSYCKKHSETEVPDPYYGGPKGFEKVLDLLEDGCEVLLDTIISQNS
ncbi:uncharacterized protein LOC110035394 [Phalaenopsis equestris]|uniref:uncharacterized protein LOC110035394 n=1 Tax=Phalaenopsis equestris TaxID=78828 RepID=UPI0009E3127D|nr:uncharacterized protein LOC110035394 [Phalaenopsis equestris]